MAVVKRKASGGKKYSPSTLEERYQALVNRGDFGPEAEITQRPLPEEPTYFEKTLEMAQRGAMQKPAKTREKVALSERLEDLRERVGETLDNVLEFGFSTFKIVGVGASVGAVSWLATQPFLGADAMYVGAAVFGLTSAMMAIHLKKESMQEKDLLDKI